MNGTHCTKLHFSGIDVSPTHRGVNVRGGWDPRNGGHFDLERFEVECNRNRLIVSNLSNLWPFQVDSLLTEEAREVIYQLPNQRWSGRGKSGDFDQHGPHQPTAKFRCWGSVIPNPHHSARKRQNLRLEASLLGTGPLYQVLVARITPDCRSTFLCSCRPLLGPSGSLSAALWRRSETVTETFRTTSSLHLVSPGHFL